jgi:two-component system, chemotaxis family, sensor kinase CheA
VIDLSEYKAAFLEELVEQLQVIEDEIMRLEQGGETETDSGIQRLFRAAHTLKGSSAAMGFEKMKELTHEMEHLLDKVRNHELKVAPSLVDLLLTCLDLMGKLKDEIAEQNQELSDISFLIHQLKSYVEGDDPLTTAPAKPEEDTKLDFQLTAEALNKAEAAIEAGMKVIWINVTVVPECEMKLVRAHFIEAKLCDLGDVLHTEPSLTQELEDDNRYRSMYWLVSLEAESNEIEHLIGSLMDVEKMEITEFDPRNHSKTKVENIASHEQVHDAIALPHEKTKAQTIRIHVDRLEHLMNLVGELVIDQTRIQQVDKIFHQRFGSDETVEELGQIADHLSRIVGELQESVMKARMLPIEQLFNRFPRMVRDLSHALHKEIDLILDGKQTELDRTLIDEIGDPLIHLIRNAVDHGIEPAEVRRANGKPVKGILRIAAAHEDNQIVITVKDDGTGIDPEKIKQSAVHKGVISSQEALQLSEQEAILLIFHPGFSTAAAVSDISGRGVGMDIVKTHIERLNGLIDVETELGKGTTFKIQLPLTLAIITGLMVNVSKQTYILPMGNVAEIIRVEPHEIKTIRGMPIITIRNQVIPVQWLHDTFGYPRATMEKKNIPLVIVGRAEKRVALVVDDLLGNQEIVIKSMGSYVGQVEGISGATILGDGQVALILDIAGIMKLVR